ncbi:unnamed protein product [Paramecium sonneborni]|uniref:Uncharacterized protein n=1 Tax=Paramecium sonneborni TaxID=65129 RepID=A0A8S1PED8_9CILI|nr:unnamed protein product [Paramecium sonneborni]CAD8101517.1 unnamed protein product [Paramecium sonneborni]
MVFKDLEIYAKNCKYFKMLTEHQSYIHTYNLPTHQNRQHLKNWENTYFRRSQQATQTQRARNLKFEFQKKFFQNLQFLEYFS